MIHGEIDGYSRLITYLRASTNNSAPTVLSAFTSAVEEYGLPSCIRIDRGGENVLVTQFMLEHPERGRNRQSVIAGHSVHNQKIERLWRDLYSGCVCLFYNFFYFLEEIRLLDHNDPLDLYALLSSSFQFFKRSWIYFGMVGLITHSEQRETGHHFNCGSLDLTTCIPRIQII